MATDKQLAWIKKLADWKGIKVDLDTISKLGNGELDEIFDSLKTIKVSNGKKQPELKPLEQPSYNGARFGLACKIVLTSVNHDFVFNNREIYIKRILQYYQVMTEAEKAQQGLVVVGAVDADSLLDEQRDKALIVSGVM